MKQNYVKQQDQCTSEGAGDEDVVSSVSAFFMSSVTFTLEFDSPGIGNSIQESRWKD